MKLLEDKNFQCSLFKNKETTKASKAKIFFFETKMNSMQAEDKNPVAKENMQGTEMNLSQVYIKKFFRWLTFFFFFLAFTELVLALNRYKSIIINMDIYW